MDKEKYYNIVILMILILLKVIHVENQNRVIHTGYIPVSVWTAPYPKNKQTNTPFPGHACLLWYILVPPLTHLCFVKIYK